MIAVKSLLSSAAVRPDPGPDEGNLRKLTAVLDIEALN